MLNELMIKNAKAQQKPYKLADGGGLVLLVHTNGTRYWRLRYRFLGKEKTLAFGIYPQVSLKDARLKRDAAKLDLANGIDPSFKKKTEKIKALIAAVNSFESIALEWHGKQKSGWSERHAFNVLRRLEKNVFPFIGKRPISEISASEVLIVLRSIENRDALETTKRALQGCGQIFRYAIATGRAERDPTRDLSGALKVHKPEHHKKLVENELPEFFQKLELYDGSLYTKKALEIVLHTFVRTHELRGAKWEEVNFDKAEWRIPAERMKMGEEHIVPLSTQTIVIFKELQYFKSSGFIFPGNTSPLKYMSENTMLYAMYRMGYHNRATVHGFRSTASTILNESNLFRPEVIEKQLAHEERNKVRAAYNAAEYLPERKIMMQWWSDFLQQQIRS